MSWAIPKLTQLPTQPLDQLGNGAGGETNIWAVETQPHPIRYTFFEARGVKEARATAGWDFGEYRVSNPRREGPLLCLTVTRRSFPRCARREDLGRIPTTREQRTSGKRTSSLRASRVVIVETLSGHSCTLILTAYYRATFQDVPSRWGRPAQRSKPDEGEHRAFIIELVSHILATQ